VLGRDLRMCWLFLVHAGDHVGARRRGAGRPTCVGSRTGAVRSIRIIGASLFTSGIVHTARFSLGGRDPSPVGTTPAEAADSLKISRPVAQPLSAGVSVKRVGAACRGLVPSPCGIVRRQNRRSGSLSLRSGWSFQVSVSGVAVCSAVPAAFSQ